MNHRLSLGACLVTTVMTACAQEAPRLVPPVQPTSVQRLIIRFATTQAVWGSAELAQLRTTLAADVQPVAAVSDRAWVYTVQALPGQSSSTLIQALRTRPEVTHVEVDRLVRTP